jgi:hypothetical protein
MGCGQSGQTAVQAVGEILVRFAEASRLMHDRSDDGECNQFELALSLSNNRRRCEVGDTTKS